MASIRAKGPLGVEVRTPWEQLYLFPESWAGRTWPRGHVHGPKRGRRPRGA